MTTCEAYTDTRGPDGVRVTSRCTMPVAVRVVMGPGWVQGRCERHAHDEDPGSPIYSGGAA